MSGEAMALGAAFLYASSTFTARLAMQRGIKAEAAIVFTLICNSILFLSMLGMRVALGTMPPVGIKLIILFAMSGILGPVLGRSTLYSSVRLIGPSRTSTIKTVSPVVAALLAVAFLGEQVGLAAAAGIGLVVLGIYVISREKEGQRSTTQQDQTSRETAASEEMPRSVYSLGVLLALASAFFYASANVLRRYTLLFLPDALLGSAVGGLSATIILVALAALRGHLRACFCIENKVARRWLVTSGIFSTFALITNYQAMAMLEASIAIPLVNVEPLFVMFISLVLFRGREERVTWQVGAGAIAILAGVWALMLA